MANLIGINLHSTMFLLIPIRQTDVRRVIEEIYIPQCFY